MKRVLKDNKEDEEKRIHKDFEDKSDKQNGGNVLHSLPLPNNIVQSNAVKLSAFFDKFRQTRSRHNLLITSFVERQQRGVVVRKENSSKNLVDYESEISKIFGDDSDDNNELDGDSGPKEVSLVEIFDNQNVLQENVDDSNCDVGKDNFQQSSKVAKNVDNSIELENTVISNCYSQTEFNDEQFIENDPTKQVEKNINQVMFNENEIKNVANVDKTSLEQISDDDINIHVDSMTENIESEKLQSSGCLGRKRRKSINSDFSDFEEEIVKNKRCKRKSKNRKKSPNFTTKMIHFSYAPSLSPKKQDESKSIFSKLKAATSTKLQNCREIREMTPMAEKNDFEENKHRKKKKRQNKPNEEATVKNGERKKRSKNSPPSPFKRLNEIPWEVFPPGAKKKSVLPSPSNSPKRPRHRQDRPNKQRDCQPLRLKKRNKNKIKKRKKEKKKKAEKMEKKRKKKKQKCRERTKTVVTDEDGDNIKVCVNFNAREESPVTSYTTESTTENESSHETIRKRSCANKKAKKAEVLTEKCISMEVETFVPKNPRTSPALIVIDGDNYEYECIDCEPDEESKCSSSLSKISRRDSSSETASPFEQPNNSRSPSLMRSPISQLESNSYEKSESGSIEIFIETPKKDTNNSSVKSPIVSRSYRTPPPPPILRYSEMEITQAKMSAVLNDSTNNVASESLLAFDKHSPTAKIDKVNENPEYSVENELPSRSLSPENTSKCPDSTETVNQKNNSIPTSNADPSHLVSLISTGNDQLESTHLLEQFNSSQNTNSGNVGISEGVDDFIDWVLDTRSNGNSQTKIQNNISMTSSHSAEKRFQKRVDSWVSSQNSPGESADRENFLNKLNRQERIVEEVKLSLKPHYNGKRITKEEYKAILKKAVHKIYHSKSGKIDPNKIRELVAAYVKKYRYWRN